jgi:hypothetical protein
MGIDEIKPRQLAPSVGIGATDCAIVTVPIYLIYYSSVPMERIYFDSRLQRLGGSLRSGDPLWPSAAVTCCIFRMRRPDAIFDCRNWPHRLQRPRLGGSLDIGDPMRFSAAMTRYILRMWRPRAVFDRDNLRMRNSLPPSTPGTRRCYDRGPPRRLRPPCDPLPRRLRPRQLPIKLSFPLLRADFLF